MEGETMTTHQMRIRALLWHVTVLLILFLGTTSWAIAQTARTVTYYYTDPQGTVLATADAAGNTLSTGDYHAYGSAIPSATESVPSFTGHVVDPESSFLYAQQRYYDPEIGRFLSVDPIAVSPERGVNRYWYASNNPFRYTDPDGRESVGELLDANATAAANRGSNAATYGWAFLAVTWNASGAEGTSRLASEGWSNAT